MKDYALESAGDTALSFSKIFISTLIGILIISSSVGFLLPPIWKLNKIDCAIEDSIVEKKGKVEHCYGDFCYTEYYLRKY